MNIRHFEGHQYIEIPHLISLDQHGPGWIDPVLIGEPPGKPWIKCQCGSLANIGLHHVYANGRVFASVLHHKIWQGQERCGWHVFVWLLDYTGGEYPPEAET